MFEIDLVDTCGDMLSLALEEALGEGSVAIVGPKAGAMKFLSWKPKRFTNPLSLDGIADYDIIVCIQCLQQLHGIKLINIDNKIYEIRGTKLVNLDKQRSRQANAFMKRAGIKIPCEGIVVLPLELHSFLSKAEKAMSSNGRLLFIDSGSPSIFESATLMTSKYLPLSRFLGSTSAGKLHVINCNPFLANSPHLIRDSAIWTIINKLDCKNKLVPWLDLEKNLSSEEKSALEPYLTRMSSVFTAWGSIIADYRASAKTIKRLLMDSDGLTELYCSLFVLNGIVSNDFSEKAWLRTNELLNLPTRPEFFAVSLSKNI